MVVIGVFESRKLRAYNHEQLLERMDWFKPKTLDFCFREKKHFHFTSQCHFNIVPVTAYYYYN